MITKQVMIEYELVRQSGLTNMFDYYTVMRIARRTGLDELSLLTLDEYKDLLMNFGKLMKEHQVTQEPMEAADKLRDEYVLNYG